MHVRFQYLLILLQLAIKQNLQVSSSFVLVSEDTSRLNNKVSSSLTPWDILRVPSDVKKYHKL